MAILPAGVPLEPGAGLLQQLRGHGQIDLRGRQAGVPEVHGQVVQEPLHVRPLPVPRRQPVDREGVPEVVQPGLIAGVSRTVHLGALPEASERALQRPQRDGGPALAEK
jgi:hypothetical protein